MERRTAGLILAVVGIVGYLFAGSRARYISMQIYQSRNWSEGHGFTSTFNVPELTHALALWTGAAYISSVVAAFGIAVIALNYNRIRRSRKANGRQSDTDHR